MYVYCIATYSKQNMVDEFCNETLLICKHVRLSATLLQYWYQHKSPIVEQKPFVLYKKGIGLNLAYCLSASWLLIFLSRNCQSLKFIEVKFFYLRLTKLVNMWQELYEKCLKHTLLRVKTLQSI